MNKKPNAQQPFGVIGDLVELAFFYYLYVKPKILGFKSPQPRQAPRRCAIFSSDRKLKNLKK